MASCQHRLSLPLKRPAVRMTGMVLQGMLSSKALIRCHSASKRISCSGSPRAQTQRHTRAAGIKICGGLPRRLILHRWTSNCTNGTSSGGPRQAVQFLVTAECSTYVRTFHLPSSARGVKDDVVPPIIEFLGAIVHCERRVVPFGNSACCFKVQSSKCHRRAVCCCGDMAMDRRACFALQAPLTIICPPRLPVPSSA
jgi:hypothetical protein